MLVVSFKVYFIDTWDNEAFTVSNGPAKIFQTTKNHGNAKADLCGVSGSNDEVRTIVIPFIHSGESAVIQLRDYLD
jgi:hypothetical protein